MIIKNCNVNKLHAELVGVGINPFPAFELENGDGDFTFKDGTDMELVQQIIGEHDSTPLSPKQNLEQKVLEQEKVINDLVALLADKGVIW